MRYIIRHTTVYHYTTPANYTIQTLRLTPRPDAHQRIIRWNLHTPGGLQPSIDAYGNQTHTLTINQPHSAIELRVDGLIEMSPLTEGRIIEESGLPVQAFQVATSLTQADARVRAFFSRILPNGIRAPEDALALAHHICDVVAYEPGTTDVTTAAGEVLELGHGVCQDHAHLFLACVRGMGLPARYVSGYLYTTAEHAASHAWVDVWLKDHGWVSIDVTNRQYASEQHCRLAVARDYDSASPVRGVRTGGGRESMAVHVHVQQQ
jgi:transglutaminase-like putative cysteine protease